jgi:hypothetical protein
MVLVALLSLVLATWIDTLTGLQISVFFLYIVPVVWATWFLGLGCGLGMSMLATAAHRWADWPAPGSEMNIWPLLERGLSSFVLLGFIAYSFHTFKRGRKSDRERIEQLEALVRLCPVCNRVHRTSGGWQNLEECLAERPVLPPKQRLCPECSAARPPEEDGL